MNSKMEMLGFWYLLLKVRHVMICCIKIRLNWTVSGRVLYDKSLDSDVRVKLLNVLSVAALKDDVILLLHQDRREHIIMTYAFDIDRHPPEEQLPLAQFVSIHKIIRLIITLISYHNFILIYITIFLLYKLAETRNIYTYIWKSLTFSVLIVSNSWQICSRISAVRNGCSTYRSGSIRIRTSAVTSAT